MSRLTTSDRIVLLEDVDQGIDVLSAGTVLKVEDRYGFSDHILLCTDKDGWSWSINTALYDVAPVQD